MFYQRTRWGSWKGDCSKCVLDILRKTKALPSPSALAAVAGREARKTGREARADILHGESESLQSCSIISGCVRVGNGDGGTALGE